MTKVEPIYKDGQLIECIFWCEGCKNHHSFTVRPHKAPNGASWQFNGDLNLPTFSPSLLYRTEFTNGKTTHVCHSFVEQGKIRYLSDCTHALAEQTVELPNVED